MHLASHVDASQAQATGYRHEAVMWSSEREFVRSAVEFIAAGREAEEPVMVATVPTRLDAIRRSLGTAASGVRFADMTVLGANPSCIIPAWLAFLEECDGRPARGIGEPIWVGRNVVELAECQLHEALLNLAVPPETDFWLWCPYDVRLGTAVLDEAVRTHPRVGSADGETMVHDRSAVERHAVSAFSAPLPLPPETAYRRLFEAGGLRRLRELVRRTATDAGIAADRAADLSLAVYELAANSIRHGGGHGELCLWREDHSLVAEVRDGGRCLDPLVGRRPTAPDEPAGRGLWMVNQLCDLVQLRSGEAGTTVRVHSWL